MKKIKLWIDTGYVGADYEDIIEVDDDITDDELRDYVEDFVCNYISSGWEEIEE